MRCAPILLLFLGTAAAGGERCYALDGQTLQCGPEKVLVEGIKAPGLKQPGGELARQRLQKRLRGGEVVIERRGFDQWGRTLGRLYVAGDRITDLAVSPGAPKNIRHDRK
jgi:endonuclease YncB( thermonuclease family)